MKTTITKSAFYNPFLFLTLLLFTSHSTFYGQCPVTAFANPTTVLCGSSISLTAVADGCRPLNNNFNDGTINAGGTQPWASSNGAQVQNGTGSHACVGPASEGAYSLWMGTTVAAPREITTNGYDLTACAAVSATLCFDMKYGTQGGASPCEGIDLPEEGIYVQYRIGAGAWQTLQYYDPNGGFDPTLTTWTRYCLDIPIAALGTNTSFRWYQSESSGAGFDAWGLDNMVINLNVPGYTFDWAHDAQGPSSSPATPNVQVTSNSTYTVTYTNGVETCNSSVNVTVISPTASATTSSNLVCQGSSVQLDAISSINAPPPTNCSVNASAACTPFSTIADEQQVGNGATTVGYNSGTDNVFGNYGDAYQTAQILFRASELLAAGVVAGQINSLSFDIQRIETSGGSTANSIIYPNVRISMGCTSATTLSTLITGLSQVYSGTNVYVTPGMYPFFFNQSYNWDGVSNIVVQVCWYFANGVDAQAAAPNGMGNYYAFCRYNSPGYACYRYSGTNFSPGSCGTNDFVSYNTHRPNVIFGFCKPNNANLTYNWTSNPAGFTSTAKSPTANPSQATSYTVAVNQVGMPAACAATATIPVSTYKPNVSINPNPAQICAPATSVTLNGSATTNTTVIAPKTYYSTSGSVAVPDGAILCTGSGTINNVITVSGASPTTVAANPVQSVTLNMTCTNTSDYEFYLIAPDGSQSLILDQKGNGLTITCNIFPTGAVPPTSGNLGGNYATQNPFPSTGNVNGNWTLRVIDLCKPSGIGATSLGTLNSWSINFNAPNAINSYTWSPPTNLSSVNTATTSSNTPTDRTYTLTTIDNSGCSSSQSVLVTVGCALPIELTGFDLSCQEDHILLDWEVGSQQDNEYFIVEKSYNGYEFYELGKVKGSGTTSISQHFKFADDQLWGQGITGDNIYYRLKQKDKNGEETELAIKSINRCTNKEQNCLLIYPNPNTENHFYFDTEDIRGSNFEIKIVDLFGKTVHSEKITEISSREIIKINLPEGINRGVYLVTSGNDRLKFCEQKFFMQ